MPLDEARLEELLRLLVKRDGSDLHIKVGSAPRIRVAGHLETATADPPTGAETERLAHAILPADRADEFMADGEADFAIDRAGIGRFRVNVYRQRGTVALVFRAVTPDMPSFESLGLPPAVRRLAEERRGLVLVTGPTGSGKTTTVAAMIDHVNRTRAVNIVTVEDPIEVLHHDKQAIVSQREIGSDTGGFAQAMRRVLRQDPDVIFVGEMRDEETVWAAMTAAETGHLVISTLHTAGAVETINRIIDLFPAQLHRQLRLSLGASLRGVVSQRLLERADGEGRVAAVEVLVNTGRVAERISHPDAPGDSLHEIVAAGDYYGMQTFDQSLHRLLTDGTVTLRDALAAASSRSDLCLAIQLSGATPVSPAEGPRAAGDPPTPQRAHAART